MSTTAFLLSGVTARWCLNLRCHLAPGALLLVSLIASTVHAGPREQALQIHNRIAGVPPSEQVLLDMAADIEGGNVAAAVNKAMDNEAFYSVTLKNMATPWTNREQTVFAPLNDYTATFIGLVRDETGGEAGARSLNEILSSNDLYISNASGLPAYSPGNNDHYATLESGGTSLKDTLVPRQQSTLNGLPTEASAGVMTSRAAARAFFVDGTNRAMLRFTLMNHLCRDLEQLHDTSLVPDRIRQDVSRSPGGDSRVFLNSCMGCHNGMDPMAQAFAYYDFLYKDTNPDTDDDPDTGRIHYATTEDPERETRVVEKYHFNASTFRYGYVTQTDDWDNYWRKGQNASLGWGTALPDTETKGAKSLGQELANSRAFAYCHVERVFRHVCLRKPERDDQTDLETMTNSFMSGYKLKQVFRDTAEYCLVDNTGN